MLIEPALRRLRVALCAIARRVARTPLESDDPTLYPFIPKSNAKLRAGQFWAIPLSDGRFACGRVMRAPAYGQSDRVGVQVGLMNWVGSQPPTANDLRGVSVIDEAISRFEAISGAGGAILGFRDLALDCIKARHYLSLEVGSSTHGWGWKVIAAKAEERFVSRSAA